MKYFIVFTALLACVATTYAASAELGKRIECFRQAKSIQPRIYESKIRDAIEDLRKQLKEGFVKYGIPPLDPLDVTNKQIVINHELLALDTTLTALSQGAAGFTITHLSLSLLGLNLKISLKFPSFSAKGDYAVNLNTTFFPQNVFGKGSFDVSARDFDVDVKGKITVSFVHGKLVPQLKTFEIDMRLAEFALDLTGFMNDEELSKQLSTTLTNDLPQMLQDYKPRINAVIKENLHIINDMLAGRSMFSEMEERMLAAYVINCGGY